MNETDRTPQRPSVADLLNGDRLLSIQDVADKLGIVKKTVQNWVSVGTLPAIKLGRERYVLQSKLREILEQKTREAVEVAARRQQDEARKRELTWLLSHEPEQGWVETPCAGCFTTINASREQRLDGRIFCEPCQDSGRPTSPTKEQIYRQVKVEIEERNRLVRQNLTPWEEQLRHDRPAAWEMIERERLWMIIRCGECKRPLAVRVEDILDPRFLPVCGHEPPFGGGIPSENADFAEQTYRDMRRNIAEGLAQVEATERNTALDDYDPIDPLWAVYPCAQCGTAAASTPQKALIGGARCRLCFGRPIKHSNRIDAIMRQLRTYHPSLSTELAPCLCQSAANCPNGYSEIHEQAEHGPSRPLLSWCRSRSMDEKDALARAYAERVGLDTHELIWLLEDVVNGDDLHLERPLIGPPITP